MKTIRKIFLLLVAILGTFTMVSCGDKDPVPPGPSDTTLSTAKTNAKSTIDAYKNASDYRTAEQATLAAAKTAAKTAIDAATSSAQIDELVAAAKVTIDAIKTNAQLTAQENAATLATAKTTAISALGDYKNAANYRTAEQALLETAITNGTTAINAATDQAGIDSALAAAKLVINAIKTKAAYEEEETEYTVTFNSNGGSTVANATIAYNGKVTKPADPTKDGYSFVGWYKEAALTNVYDFNTEVTANATLYAKWTFTGAGLVSKPVVYANDFSDSSEVIGTQASEGSYYYTTSKEPESAANISTVIENGKLVVKDTDAKAANQTYLINTLNPGMVSIYLEISGTTNNGSWSWVTLTDLNGRYFDIRTTGTGKMGYTVNGTQSTESVNFAANDVLNVKIDVNTLTGELSLSLVNGSNKLEKTSIQSGLYGFKSIQFKTADSATNRNLSVDNLVIGFEEAALAGIRTKSAELLDAAKAAYTEADYSTSNWNTLVAAYNTGVSALETATTTAEVVSAQTTAIAGMKNILKSIVKPTLSKSGNVISWSAVTDAVSYQVYINGEAVGEPQTTLSYTFTGTTAGTHSIQVVAVADGTTKANSNLSDAQNIVILPTLATPSGFAVSSGVLSWTAVTDATGYVVTVNGVAQDEQTENTFTLSTTPGVYAISVVAKGVSTTHNNSAASSATNYIVDGKIATPTLTQDDNVISWTAINGAKGYIVYVGSDAQAEQTGTTYTVSKDTLGTYVITVVAVADTQYTGLEDSLASTSKTVLILEQLAKPVVAKNETTISWAAVANAEGYEIYFGDKLVQELASSVLSFDISNIVATPASYNVTVVAVGNGTSYSDSDASSDEVEYIVTIALTSPIISASDNVISWQAVPHATGYIVYLGEDAQPKQTTLTFTLNATASGSTTITVKAIGNEAEYLDSSSSNSITITATVPTTYTKASDVTFTKTTTGTFTPAISNASVTLKTIKDTSQTYDSVTYTQGIKLAANTSDKFTIVLPAKYKVTFLVLNTSSTAHTATFTSGSNTLPIDLGKSAWGTVSLELPAGTHEFSTTTSKEITIYKITLEAKVTTYSSNIESVSTLEDLNTKLADTSVDYIKLTSNITTDTAIKVLRSLTLDLNGHNILFTGEDDLHLGSKDTDAAGDTVNISLINSSSTKSTVTAELDYALFIRGICMNVNIQNIDFVGRYGGIVTNGTFKTTTTIVNAVNCNFTGSEEAGAYFAGNYTFNFVSCEFTGYTGIYLKSGNYLFDDCTITGTGAKLEPSHYGNGYNETGDALAINSATGYAQTLNVKLSNCTISSTYGYAVHQFATAATGLTATTYSKIFVVDCNLDGLDVE